MKRIVVVKWDLRRGPLPVVQYPPEKTFLDNETFLKLWSIHELQENPVISMGRENMTFFSYREALKTGTYFVVFATDERLEEGFNELHAGMSKSLLATLDTPHFLPSLQEMYKIFGEINNLAQDQLIASLFQDPAKSTIFDEIRGGLFNKDHLQKSLQKRHGLSVVNFDLLIFAFIRLGVIRPEILFEEEYLFLQKDYFVARLPPDYAKSEDILGSERAEYLAQLREYFSENTNLTSIVIPPAFINYFKNPIFSLLQKLGNSPLPVAEVQEILKGDEKIYAEMQRYKVIIEINKRVFLLAGISFIPIKPTYVLGELKKRFLDKQIPVEILSRQMEILENAEI